MPGAGRELRDGALPAGDVEDPRVQSGSRWHAHSHDITVLVGPDLSGSGGSVRIDRGRQHPAVHGSLGRTGPPKVLAPLISAARRWPASAAEDAARDRECLVKRERRLPVPGAEMLGNGFARCRRWGYTYERQLTAPSRPERQRARRASAGDRAGCLRRLPRTAQGSGRRDRRGAQRRPF